MPKKKETDKLILDMRKCEKAGFGVHYGDWMATQPQTVKVDTDVAPKGWKQCLWCRGYYKPKRSDQKYCDIFCQSRAQYARDKARRAAL